MERKYIISIETVTVLSTNRMELLLLQPCIHEEVDTHLTVHALTCDQASLIFCRGGKVRLIQLLEYLSAAP